MGKTTTNIGYFKKSNMACMVIIDANNEWISILSASTKPPQSIQLFERGEDYFEQLEKAVTMTGRACSRQEFEDIHNQVVAQFDRAQATNREHHG